MAVIVVSEKEYYAKRIDFMLRKLIEFNESSIKNYSSYPVNGMYYEYIRPVIHNTPVLKSEIKGSDQFIKSIVESDLMGPELAGLDKQLNDTLQKLNIKVNVPDFTVKTVEINKSTVKANNNIEYFKNLLKLEALNALKNNRAELDQMQIDYKKALSDTSGKNQLWPRMAKLINADKRLYDDFMHYKEECELLRSEVFSKFSASGVIWFSKDNGEYRLLVNDKTISKDDRIKAIGKELSDNLSLVEIYNKQMIEIIATRESLRELYPELAVFDPVKVKSSIDRDNIYKLMCKGFDKAREAQEQVKIMVLEDRLPINIIDPVVNNVLKNLEKDGTFKDAHFKQQVYKWLEDNKKTKTIFTIIGMSVSIVLMAAAFFTTGGAALVFGLAAAIAGLGMGAFELETAGKKKELADAQNGGKSLLIGRKDAESAKFDYTMAWVNLFLSALDVAISAKAVVYVIRADEAIKTLNKLKSLDDIPNLSASEIYHLKNMSKEEVMEILANYRKSAKRNINKIAELFKARERQGIYKGRDNSVYIKAIKTRLKYWQE